MWRRHWRKALVGALLGVPALAALVYFVAFPWYVRSGTYNPEIERVLGDALGLRVTLGALEGSVLSDVILRDLSGVDPETGESVFTVPEVRLVYDPMELREGKVRSLALVRPRIRLTHEKVRGWRWRRFGAWVGGGGAGGAPIAGPPQADDLKIEGLEITVWTDDLVARVSGLDVDAGRVSLDQPIRMSLPRGARIGFARPLEADLDAATLEAAPVTLACKTIEMRPFGDRPEGRIEDLAFATEDLRAITPALAALGLRDWTLSSGPTRADLDLELSDGRLTVVSSGAAPRLEIGLPNGERHPAGGAWDVRMGVTLDSREAILERLRLVTESYGTYEAQATGSLATQEVLVRSWSAEKVDLALLDRLAGVRATGWQFGGVTDLGSGTGRFRRDERTGEWDLTVTGTAVAERLAAAYRTDASIVQGSGVEVRTTIGLDSRAGTCVIGTVGSASRLANAGGGFEIRGDGGADGVVFRGVYRWREGVFDVEQVDARIRDLVVAGQDGGRALVLGEPVTVGFVRSTGEEGQPHAPRLRYDRRTGRLRFAGLKLSPRRGGDLTVAADLSVHAAKFDALEVEGRGVDLPFVQDTARRTLGWAAPFWTLTGSADFSLKVRPGTTGENSYQGNFVLKGPDLALEAVTDPGRPIGLAGDLDGAFQLDTSARMLRLSNGHARLGSRGHGDYRMVLDLRTGWPTEGVIDLYAMDGGWTWDLVRRAARVAEDLFEGKGQINGRITLGSVTRGTATDGKIHFKGNLTSPGLFSRHYDVELTGGQIGVECEALFPERGWDRPVFTATVDLNGCSARSDGRLYEAEKIALRASTELRFDRPADGVAGRIDLRVRRAEILWDTLYDEIRKDPIIAQVRGAWDGAARRLRLDRFDLEHPNLGYARGSGESTVHRIDENLVLVGRVDLEDSSFALQGATVAGLAGRVPFWIGYPLLPDSQAPEGLREADWARVAVKSVEKGRFRMEGLDLEFAWVGNRVLTRRPLELPVAGGTMRFLGFTARGLIPRGLSDPYRPEWRADALELAGVRPGLALYMAGIDRPLPGSLSGRIEQPVFENDVLDLRGGELSGDLLGGQVTLRDLQVRNPISRWRLEADIAARGIDLLEACRVFPEVGTIEGKVDAVVRDLEVFEGTPVAFELDVDNASWSGDGGVRQTIDHQAARSLGTFSGGVSAMFEDTVRKRTFKYIHFGVVARMQYQAELGRTFIRMRGKYRQQTLAFPPITTYRRVERPDFGPLLDQAVDGEEYFLVGATTSGVNLINGEPRGMVDYVELFERAKRVIARGREAMEIR